MGKSSRKILAIILSIGILATLVAVPMTVNAVPAGETYEAYDVIEYADFLDTGENHLTAEGVTLSGQHTLYHYTATSATHSAIYRFRWVAGACSYFQAYPGKYVGDNPFQYRINTGASASWQKRYAPGNAAVSAGSITSGDEFDIEIGRLMVASGDNVGKYYSYFKVDGSLIFGVYVDTSYVDAVPDSILDSIQFSLGSPYDCGIKPIPAPAEQEAADALYYYYDEIDYNDLLENGNPLSSETQMGTKTFTYNRTANTYSAILRYRWKAVATSKFQLSFDKAGSGLDYMFGAQLYAPGSEGHTTSSIRLRPGLDSAAWNNIGYDIQTGEYYDIEFARLKVKNGENAGKYYMYFKMNDVLISESYVAANVVDSVGNYTSNPGPTACHLSNEIYLTFWGGGGNDKIMKIPTPDVYDDYDEIAFSDLYVGSTPMGGTVKDGSGNYTYNATSPSYSLKLSYRWTAATEGDKKFTTYLDDWKYPFCFAVKTPNQSGFGATAGPNGSWHLVPSDDSMIVDMDEPIVGGQDYDIEVGRLKVVDGDNQGKYYVYFKVNNELIKSYYYDGVSNGTYGSSNTALSNNIIISAPAGNKFRAIPVPETYEDYDEVYYSNLMVNGNPVANERSGSGTTYTYNKTTESGSAVLKLRYIPNGTETEGQISFDRRGSNNAINYMFGIQIYKPTTEYPNGRIWLRPGYGPSVGFEEPIVPGNSYDVEFARLKVKTGINKGKYYMYFKMNGVLLAEDYVAANVVDSNGNYTSDPSSTACTISDEIYITFWGGGGATITNPAYTETYCDYDDVGYSDLSVGGSPVSANKRNMSGGTTFTYNRTSDTGSVVFKYRWKIGDVAKFQMSFDEKASTDRSNMEYMFGAWLSNPGDTYANGDMYLRPSYGSHVGLAAALTPGGTYDIEYGRLKVATGPNKDKYYVYIKIDDVLIDESYVAADVVDADGNYTTKPGDVQCNVKAGEIFIAYWGSNGNMIGTYGGIKGDLDDNFVVDASDMAILRKVILQYEEVSGISADIADFNSDSIVDVKDYKAMKSAIVH